MENNSLLETRAPSTEYDVPGAEAPRPVAAEELAIEGAAVTGGPNHAISERSSSRVTQVAAILYIFRVFHYQSMLLLLKSSQYRRYRLIKCPTA